MHKKSDEMQKRAKKNLLNGRLKFWLIENICYTRTLITNYLKKSQNNLLSGKDDSFIIIYNSTTTINNSNTITRY